MRTRRAGLVLALLGALSGTAGADPGVWVSTHPIQTGAVERVEHGADGSVWAVVDHSRVLRSTDQGTTWVPVNPVPVSGLPLSGPDLGGSSDTSVAPVSATEAVGVNGDAFSRTTDGGLTWTSLAVPKVTRSGFEFAHLLRRTGGRFWAAMGGDEMVGGCPVPLRTTPLLSSSDGKAWRRVDLPVPSGMTWDLKFADALHGAVSVYEYDFTKEQCGFSGSSSRTAVFVTRDGGRSWRRVHTCEDTCVLAWSRTTTRKLLLVRGGGAALESGDDGASFHAAQALPSSPVAFFVTSADCVAARCWVLHNGGGILRRDGTNEWQTEVSGASVVGVCVPTLTALDLDHAVAAGPHALMTRRDAGGSVAAAGPTTGPRDLPLPGGAVLDPTGTVRVRVARAD